MALAANQLVLLDFHQEEEKIVATGRVTLDNKVCAVDLMFESVRRSVGGQRPDHSYYWHVESSPKLPNVCHSE